MNTETNETLPAPQDRQSLALAVKLAESKASAAHQAYRDACSKLQAAQEALIKEIYGVERESIVRRKKDGKEFKVATLSFFNNSEPMISGYPRKKSGSFGAQNQYIGSGWEVVK